MNEILDVYPFTTPPVFYDIGCRGGVEKFWQGLIDTDKVIAYGFDPDVGHCKKLSDKDQKSNFIPVALSNYTGTSDFYITRNSGCCSCKEPRIDFLQQYPYTVDSFNVKKKTTINVTTLNNLISQNEIKPPNYLKIDVQGLEYEVLEGCSEHLHNVYGIKLETHFQPLYEGEKTFFEIYNLLVNKYGFMLRQLNNISYYDGDQLEYDAFFTRGPLTPDDTYLKDMFFSKIYNLDPPRIACMSRSHENNNTIKNKEFYKKYGYYQ
jgi:FkbM family methyltransferase